jgi:hypothetical protein
MMATGNSKSPSVVERMIAEFKDRPTESVDQIIAELKKSRPKKSIDQMVAELASSDSLLPVDEFLTEAEAIVDPVDRITRKPPVQRVVLHRPYKGLLPATPKGVVSQPLLPDYP